MCRLTLIQPKTRDINPLFICTMATEIMSRNSLDSGNDDGTGLSIVTNDHTHTIKTARSALTFYESDEWFKLREDNWHNFLNEKYVSFLGHVRAASPGIKVNTKNSHPFTYGKIVAAHNGAIRNKEDFDKKIDSDSGAFFKYLSDRAEDPLEYKFLKEHIETINGPFCMLLHDTRQKSDTWVVTGKGRELHVAENEHFLIINTTDVGIEYLANMKYMLKGMNDSRHELLDLSKPKKLKEETIFMASNGKLKPIGPVKETNTYKYTRQRNTHSRTSYTGGHYRGYEQETPSSEESREAAKLWWSILKRTNLSHVEIAKITEMLGIITKNGDPKAWLDMSMEELKQHEEFLDFLENKGLMDDIEQKSIIWTSILANLKSNNHSTVNDYCHETTDGEYLFPFWFNSTELLAKISNKVKEDAGNVTLQ